MSGSMKLISVGAQKVGVQLLHSWFRFDATGNRYPIRLSFFEEKRPFYRFPRFRRASCIIEATLYFIVHEKLQKGGVLSIEDSAGKIAVIKLASQHAGSDTLEMACEKAASFEVASFRANRTSDDDSAVNCYQTSRYFGEALGVHSAAQIGLLFEPSDGGPDNRSNQWLSVELDALFRDQALISATHECFSGSVDSKGLSRPLANIEIPYQTHRCLVESRFLVLKESFKACNSSKVLCRASIFLEQLRTVLHKFRQNFLIFSVVLPCELSNLLTLQLQLLCRDNSTPTNCKESDNRSQHQAKWCERLSALNHFGRHRRIKDVERHEREDHGGHDHRCNRRRQPSTGRNPRPPELPTAASFGNIIALLN